MTWPLTKVYESDRGAVRYEVTGSGKPMILMHGTPFWSYEWHRVAPILAEHRRIFVYDMLGYGESAKEEGQDVSLAAQTDLFIELLNHWSIQRPEIIAHDFGGAIALRAHLLRAIDYEKLMLVDPVALAPWGTGFVRHIQKHESAFAGLPHYLHQSLVGSYIRTALHRDLSDRELYPYLAPWLGQVGQSALYRQVAQMDEQYTDEIEPLLGDVRCPVSLMWGEQDGWLPLRQGELLRARLGLDKLVTVPRAGHLVQEDAPEHLVAEAYRFFAF